MALKLADFRTEVHNDWCPGCGDFGILSSIQMTLADMQLETHNVAIFSGVGCSGKTIHYINTYGIHTLHGRVLPYAIGAKLANPDLQIIAVGGDGDGLGIGAGHFVNTGRRNVDFTYVLFNNGVYGLTKGQAAPTLPLNMKTKSIPKPNIVEAVNPILLAFASGYTFIARGYSFDVNHLKGLIKKGIEHRGTAFIDVLQPCPTYNDINTKEWYGGEDKKDDGDGKPLPRVYKLEDEEYDPIIRNTDNEDEVAGKVNQMVNKAGGWGDKIPIGVFYQNETVPTYDQRIKQSIQDYTENPPVKQTICDYDGSPTTDLTKLFQELRVT